MKTYTPRFFLIVAIFFISIHVKAQFNLQVGYGLGFVSLTETRNLFTEYKLQNPWLTSDFQDIKYLNGFLVGFRQSWNGISLGLNWKYRFTDTKSEGIQPISSTLFTKELFVKLHTYSFFIETSGEWFHLGTSLDLNLLYIKEKHTGINDKLEISGENKWGSQFYLNVNFPASSSCQISLQPFYFMPWSDFDLTGLKNNFQINTGPVTRKESFKHFGISLIISNGPQNGN